MFPYVRRNLQAYVEEHWDKEQLQADVKLLRELSQEDAKNGVAVPNSPRFSPSLYATQRNATQRSTTTCAYVAAACSTFRSFLCRACGRACL
jgi:hypothetical protein